MSSILATQIALLRAGLGNKQENRFIQAILFK